jgi:hypothetical protein
LRGAPDPHATEQSRVDLPDCAYDVLS